MSFSGDLSAFRVNTGAMHERMVRGTEIQLFSAVIMDTPVDTGRLRGNWQISLDTPKTGVTDIDDKSGALTVASVVSFTATLKGGRLTYLANNLPYAERIEYGWSKVKAPEGMVRRNVARFNRILEGQR